MVTKDKTHSNDAHTESQTTAGIFVDTHENQSRVDAVLERMSPEVRAAVVRSLVRNAGDYEYLKDK